MFRRPPAETDMQRHFQVSPPSVHQMIVTLERNGLIRRQPGVARSIQILVAPEDLPTLNWLGTNQSKPLRRAPITSSETQPRLRRRKDTHGDHAGHENQPTSSQETSP